ncbi:MAG: hypothetical protein ACT6WE_25820 [Shinella sp.]|uniref:hypothetical protein n=1 Tax=Shinella sp. TaxID=1870904 RepID=UPI00403666AB
MTEHFTIASGEPFREEMQLPDFDLDAHNVTVFIKAADRADLRVLSATTGNIRIEGQSLQVGADLGLPAGNYLLDILFENKTTAHLAVSAGHTLSIGDA